MVGCPSEKLGQCHGNSKSCPKPGPKPALTAYPLSSDYYEGNDYALRNLEAGEEIVSNYIGEDDMASCLAVPWLAQIFEVCKLLRKSYRAEPFVIGRQADIMRTQIGMTKR